MKSKETTIIGNTSYGYCFQPKTFPSKSKAVEYGKWMVNEGFWFAYRTYNK